MRPVDVLKYLPCTAEQLMREIDRSYVTCHMLLEKAAALKLAEQWGREPTEKGRLISRYQITELGVVALSNFKKKG